MPPIKISQVIELLEAFECDVLYSAANSEIHFGCDCGCGGDNYTDASWDAMIAELDSAEQKVIEFCQSQNMAYDYFVDNEDLTLTSSLYELYSVFHNAAFNLNPDDYMTEALYLEDIEYYKEFNALFIEYCLTFGWINDVA